MGRNEESELSLLLKESLVKGLSRDKMRRARELIDNPVYSEDNCHVCKTYGINPGKAIYDTGRCQIHVRYSLRIAIPL